MPGENNDFFSGKELQQAAKEVEQAMLVDLPSSEECAHEFSSRFEHQMTSLIRQQRARKTWRKGLQRAACVLLVLLLGGGLWLAANQQARASFFSWVQEAFENAVFLFSQQQEDAVLETVPSCQFTWLPEGYRVDGAGFENDDRRRFTAALKADGKKDTYFCCEISDKNWALSLDYDENYQIQHVTVGNELGELYVCPDGSRPNSIVWQESNGSIVLYFTGFLSETDLIKAAQGVILEYSGE